MRHEFSDPPLPVVILIRDPFAGRRSLLQEIALRDPVASLSMHGPTAGTTRVPRRSRSMGPSNLPPIYHGSTLLRFRDNRGIVS